MRIGPGLSVALLLAALLACKSSGSSKPTPAASGSSAAAEESVNETPGKFAEVTPVDVEARAIKAGFRVRSNDDNKADGMLVYELELENDDNFAYVTLVDLAFEAGDVKQHAAKLGDSTGLVVHLDQPAGKVTAQKLLDDVVAQKPLAELTRDALKDALKSTGWSSPNVESDSEDGITTVTIGAEKGDLTATVVLFDLGTSKR